MRAAPSRAPRLTSPTHFAPRSTTVSVRHHHIWRPTSSADVAHTRAPELGPELAGPSSSRPTQLTRVISTVSTSGSPRASPTDGRRILPANPARPRSGVRSPPGGAGTGSCTAQFVIEPIQPRTSGRSTRWFSDVIRPQISPSTPSREPPVDASDRVGVGEEHGRAGVASAGAARAAATGGCGR